MFGAGCFWGVEEIVRKIPGVLETEVGYAGGFHPEPTYPLVCTGSTGHAEVILINYDSHILSFEDLLKYFFRLHNPTTLNRQENDIGSQYRSIIFYQNETEKLVAEKIIQEVNDSKKWRDPVVTELSPWKIFYSAEAYHQDYLQKNPTGYNCHFLRE